MVDNYVIQVKKTQKWLNLDFNGGCELIYVDKFTDAYKFKTNEECKLFIEYHRLICNEHELFRLKVIAEQLPWS